MTDVKLALRWESTNNEWWYVTPIDYAAASGLSDLVMQMLSLEPNLLLKLTALPRIRRLESVWDDSDPHNMVAQARARVARALLTRCECSEPDQKNNPLTRAGYSGWLLYTAASAGDVGFVTELLQQNPTSVFGEGEYGITDILYGGSRSNNSDVFRVLLGFANDWVKKSVSDDNVNVNVDEGVLWEVMNRALHCAARGGNLVILKELLLDCDDVLVYRDVLGCTILHSASSKGQVEVVKHLIATYDIIHSSDNQGNTALHVAAYSGYFPVVEVLANASSVLTTMKNNNGDTYLHMAVAGFLSPGFHRIDQQMDLMKQIISNMSVNNIINITNNKGKTALHIAVVGNISLDVVDLLMRVTSIDLNARDFLKQCRPDETRASDEKDSNRSLVEDMCISTSPGTSFRYSDADLFSCTGSDDNDSEVSCEPPSSGFTPCNSERNSKLFDSAGSFRSGSARFKFMFQWSRREPSRKIDGKLDLHNTSRSMNDLPISLRQKFTNKRENSGSSTKERLASSLRRGVSQGTPPHYSPSCRVSSASSPNSVHKLKSVRSFFSGPLNGVRSHMMEKQQHKRVSSFNKSLMNHYLCFGAQDLAVEDSVDSVNATRGCRRLVF